MWEKLALIFKTKELRNKVLFVLAMLVVFRLAAAIPVPGVNLYELRQLFSSNQFFGFLNLLSGGGLDNLSLMMLGVSPYITATIIMQLLTMIFPQLKAMYQEEGEAGKQKFNQYSRILTLPLAIVQGYGFMHLLQSQNVLPELSFFDLAYNIIVVTVGAMFLMWIGELMTEKGIGNGISLLIFAGIVSGIITKAGQAYAIVSQTPSEAPTYIVFLVASFFVIAGVVLLNEGQRNIPVAYAKRIRGMKMYGGVSTHLPLKVNSAGVIPIIFALSIMLFPTMIANFLSLLNVSWLSGFANWMTQFFNNNIYYSIAYFLLVVVFTYFYTSITFDPEAISNNLQKQGAFIPGIRPGQSTSMFIHKILNRITLVGALALGIIAILPTIAQFFTRSQSFTIGGTALLIVVAVVLETVKQVEGQLSLREYE